MAGILNTDPVGILDPRSAALMQMGLSLLGQGPSRTPVSFGQSLGQAGMQGMNAYAQANQANQQQQLFAMKMAEAQRAEVERAQKAAALAQLAQDPRFANMGPLLQVAPQQAIERAFPKDNKPVVVPHGASLVDPEKPSTPLYVAPDKPTGPVSDLGKLAADFKAGLISKAEYDAKVKKLTTHQPLVTVDNRQEGEFGKVVGRTLGEQYGDLLKADMNAPATLAKYERLGSLLGQVNTGKFKGSTVDLKAAAKGLGVDLTALGIADDVAPAQAARALTNQLALELRNPAGGAGMPGAMSDQDRLFLQSMVPSLENDPGAIGQMIDYRKRLASREQQVAKMARDYRKKKGRFDEGFYDDLQSWSSKNPLFPEGGSATPSLSPKAQRYLDMVK